VGQTLSPRAAALLLATVAALLLLRLGAVPLVGPDEPRYARVAVEMQRSGDFVTPTLQGQPWLEKPALYYWLAALCFTLFGENEAAARLPSVAAALLLVGATALLGARLFGRSAGTHAGFILATSLLPFAYGRAASMDMLLAALASVATGLYGLRLLGIAGPLAVPVASAFAGLAVLAKGPLGLLLPALVVGAFLLARRNWAFLRELLSPWSLGAFLAVAAPWYLAIYRAQGRHFVDVFLLNHNVARFTSTIHNHPGPAWYYVAILLAGLFPWSGLVLPALRRAFSPGWSREGRTSFVLAWLFVPLAFFSLAGSKLPGYILPCLPPLAILMGSLSVAMGRHEPLPGWAGPRAAALVGLLLSAGLAALPAALFRLGDPAWPLAIPVAVWAVIAAFAFARQVGRDPNGALSILRTCGAGLLMLLTQVLPGVLARRESGRDLFAPAQGREVLAAGAWRTAWMAGYFYNDGKVREASVTEVMARAREGSTLALVGPSEKRILHSAPGLRVRSLAEGPRANSLVEVSREGGD
jgi:4-amino-4-deoxy-L-arabinose transferase-like glycosyltransferase